MKAIKKYIKRTYLKRKLDKFDPELIERFNAIKNFARGVRTSEYHLTNSCNLRCKGCWFFEYDFDKKSEEVKDLDLLEKFIISEKQRGVTAPVIIGGEPTLYPERIKLFRKHMPYITVSSNGLKKLKYEGFEDIAIAVSLFGGGPMDDKLRAYSASGKSFTGLFAKALKNYKDDPRVGFVYALDINGLDYIEETVKKIRDNGNVLVFNYYSSYQTDDPLQGKEAEQKLLKEALRMRSLYPETVRSTPALIRALITGKTAWGEFGYEVCPSLSQDFVGHKERFKNGNPVLPGFNAYGADLKTVQSCCVSGHCEGCRESQAVTSWMLVSFKHFLKNEGSFREWVEMAENYWSEFPWSPIHNREKSVNPVLGHPFTQAQEKTAGEVILR